MKTHSIRYVASCSLLLGAFSVDAFAVTQGLNFGAILSMGKPIGGNITALWGNNVLTLSSTDAFMTSNGHCAFNLGYDLVNSGSTDLSGIKVTLYDGDKAFTIQSNLNVAAGKTQHVNAQGYLDVGNHRVKATYSINGVNGTTDTQRSVYVQLNGNCGGTATTPPPTPAPTPVPTPVPVTPSTTSTTEDRLGFQSPTGFNTVNAEVPGWIGYAFIGHVRPDNTQDPAVPVTLSITNAALMTVEKLPQPVSQGNILVNYRLIVPANAPSGSVDITATMVYNGKTFTRTRTFQITASSTDTLSPTPTPAPTPVPTPAPVSNNPWSVIEAPQPWDYQATQPSQSSCNGMGTVYEIGPNKPYSLLRQVPWIALKACDTVKIHYQTMPYRDVIFLSNRGARNQYIKIEGVPGPNGELPILDGDNAWVDPGYTYSSYIEGTGFIMVSPPQNGQAAWGYKPGYLDISNLEIRNTHPSHNYINRSNVTGPWPNFTAGIYIERGEHIAVRNCHIHDNSIGLFENSKYDEAAQSRDLLVDGNYFHDNGVAGDAHQHNAYTEGNGTIYQFNHFGPTLVGSFGDNVKERSAGVIFRYNTFDGGVSTIALQDPQSNASYERTLRDAWGNLLVDAAYIYGNTIIRRDRAGTQAEQDGGMVRYGDGDYSWGDIRGGTLYFYNNTVMTQYDMAQYDGIGRRNGATLFTILNAQRMPVVRALNNVFYATPATPGMSAAPIAWFYYYGHADFSNNWASPNTVNTKPAVVKGPGDGLAFGNQWDGSGVSNLFSDNQNNPGFVNAAAGDFHLLPTSLLINSGQTLDQVMLNTGNDVKFEPASLGTPRKQLDGIMDMGAFEY